MIELTTAYRGVLREIREKRESVQEKLLRGKATDIEDYRLHVARLRIYDEVESMVKKHFQGLLIGGTNEEDASGDQE